MDAWERPLHTQKYFPPITCEQKCLRLDCLDAEIRVEERGATSSSAFYCFLLMLAIVENYHRNLKRKRLAFRLFSIEMFMVVSTENAGNIKVV